MSKIFDAYRKRMGDASDLDAVVRSAGAVTLYPAPHDQQLADFNRLANRILGLRFNEQGVVLSFASSARGEGASFVSYNVASHLATAFGQKVAWVDGNFVSPQGRLQDTNSPSFASMLQYPQSVHDLAATHNPHLVPGGESLQRVKGLLAGQNYIDLLHFLRGRFDFIFIDLPPVLETPDAALMAAATDGCVLVIEQKYLKRELIQHGLELLRNKGVQVLGSVINRRSFELPKVIYERL